MSTKPCLSQEYETFKLILYSATDIPNLEFQYVKSKQLKNPSWIETLHNQCDLLAKEAQLTTQTIDHISQPYRGASLLIYTARNLFEDASSNAVDTLRTIASSMDLRDHFMKKYKWNSNTISSVDWELHHFVLNHPRLLYKKFVIQFIHQWLPLNDSPQTSSPQKKCPLCNTENETIEHFLSCNHTDSKAIWSSCAIEIEQKATKGNCDPIIAKLLQDVILNWRTTSKPTQPDYCSEKYRRLFTTQAEIGWHQVIQGRLSSEWIPAQERYDPSPKTNATSLLSTLISIIISYVHSAWKLRNDAQHGSNPSFQQSKRQHRLLPRLEALYNTRNSMLALDKQYFDVPQATIELLPNHRLEGWLDQAELFVKGALQRAHIFNTSNTKPIHHYFRPQPTTQIRGNNTTSLTLRASHHLQSTQPVLPPNRHRKTNTISTSNTAPRVQPSIQTFMNTTNTRTTVPTVTTETRPHLQPDISIQHRPINTTTTESRATPSYRQTNQTTQASPNQNHQTQTNQQRQIPRIQTKLREFFSEAAHKFAKSNFRPP